MNTPLGLRLRIADLHRKPVFSKSLPVAALERLSRLAEIQGEITAEFQARTDDQNRLRLVGEASGRFCQDCQRCLQPVTQVVHSRFDLWLVDQSQIERLQRQDPNSLLAEDIHVVDDGVVDLAVLVEDELLLALDAQPCKDALCPRRPAMNYPAEAQAPVEASAEKRQRPFAGLKQQLEKRKEPE